MIDDTRRLRLSIAQVELPDGVHFETVRTANAEGGDNRAARRCLLFLGEGAEDTGAPADINEAARVEWIALDSVRDRIARGEIIGAGTQIGLLHILAFHAHQSQ
ncbi:MAG TPA: hypothetical protein VNA67_03945 [Pseudonocardiaceae bacterium]|nr:hypothetical protein [Pseudonocardiaceae bacterium]